MNKAVIIASGIILVIVISIFGIKYFGLSPLEGFKPEVNDTQTLKTLAGSFNVQLLIINAKFDNLTNSSLVVTDLNNKKQSFFVTEDAEFLKHTQTPEGEAGIKVSQNDLQGAVKGGSMEISLIKDQNGAYQVKKIRYFE